MKKKIKKNDWTNPKHAGLRQKKNLYRSVYLNDGVLSDAISYGLVCEESTGNEMPFIKSALGSLRKMVAVSFYVFYLIPFFCLYICIHSLKSFMQRILKHISGAINKANLLIEESSNNNENPVVYNQ